MPSVCGASEVIALALVETCSRRLPGGTGKAPVALAWSGVGIENPMHLLFIGAVALIVLGPKRLPMLARALGEGIREFREAIAQGANETGPPDAAGHGEPTEPVVRDDASG